MIIAFFSIDNKSKRTWFFEEIFLLADINMDIALEIFFLLLSKTEINFNDCKLHWRLYIIINALPTTKWVKLVNKKEFVVIIFDLDNEIFEVYVVFLPATI